MKNPHAFSMMIAGALLLPVLAERLRRRGDVEDRLGAARRPHRLRADERSLVGHPRDRRSQGRVPERIQHRPARAVRARSSRRTARNARSRRRSCKREAQIWAPDTTPDEFPFYEATGKYALGINLDGKDIAGRLRKRRWPQGHRQPAVPRRRLHSQLSAGRRAGHHHDEVAGAEAVQPRDVRADGRRQPQERSRGDGFLLPHARHSARGPHRQLSAGWLAASGCALRQAIHGHGEGTHRRRRARDRAVRSAAGAGRRDGRSGDQHFPDARSCV